jgi:uncharacterized membrane protein SpoIIM required for sporulation
VKQAVFEQARAERWQHFEALLDQLDGGRAAPGFPREYRLLCQDLLLARDRRFGAALVDRLNALALRGHQHLYGAAAGRVGAADLFLRRFPRAVRREARLALWIAIVFIGPLLACFWLSLRDPDFVYSVLSPAQVATFEDMYDPSAEHFGAPRQATDGVLAFFFYVGNNVAVSFRTFAGGIFFGIGTLGILFSNAILAGVLAGHLTAMGRAVPFFSFVIGHGAFELTAIALAGVSGMRLGLALLSPGQRTRGAALREAARRVVPILYGSSAMLVIAAVLEGLWSASHAIPAPVKFAVGGMLWVLVGAWLALGGRGGEAA